MREGLELHSRGSLFIGKKGIIVTGSGGSNPQIFPEKRSAKYNSPKPTIPRSNGHYRDWIDAIKGGPGRAQISNTEPALPNSPCWACFPSGWVARRFIGIVKTCRRKAYPKRTHTCGSRSGRGGRWVDGIWVALLIFFSQTPPTCYSVTDIHYHQTRHRTICQ